MEPARHHHADRLPLADELPGPFEEELEQVGIASGGLPLDRDLAVVALDFLFDLGGLMVVDPAFQQNTSQTLLSGFVALPFGQDLGALAMQLLDVAILLGPLQLANQRVELEIEAVAFGFDLVPRRIAQDARESGVAPLPALAIEKDLGELKLPTERSSNSPLDAGRLALRAMLLGHGL